MLPDESLGQGVELWLFSTSAAVILAVEVSDIQEGNDQVVEGVQAFLLDREASIAISCIATLHLDPDLSLLIGVWLLAVLERLVADDPEALEEGGTLRPFGRSISSQLAPQPKANSAERPSRSEASSAVQRSADATQGARLNSGQLELLAGINPTKIEAIAKAQAEAMIRRLDLVRREELDAAMDVARRAREQAEDLAARVGALEARHMPKSGSKSSSNT